jgi:hypothetical protein
MSYRLDLHEFRAWLYCQPRNKVLAFSRDRQRCPLAAHLSAELGEPARVDADSWALVDAPGDVNPLPGWAEHFVRLVDGLHPLPLTPSMALWILDKVDPDQHPIK